VVVLFTPRLRLILLVGLLLIAGGVGLLTITRLRSHSGTPATTPPAPVRPHHVARPARPAKPAVTPPKHATKPATAPTRHATKPATVTPATPAPAVPKPTAVDSGFPILVARALAAGHIVVVSLFDPKTKIDLTALREAEAGAAIAHAAFVPIDVSGSQIDPLNRRFGVIQDPAVLVLRAPGDLIVRIDGFADRDTVAQAAANAALPSATPAPATTGP
jgi:hypothetical protein